MKIEHLDPTTLRPHRLRAQIPEPQDGVEWDAFIENFRDGGVEAMPAVIVSNGNKVIKGWRRVLAARRLQWPKIPVLIVPDDNATTHFFEAWFGSRKMTAATMVRFHGRHLLEYARSSENRRLRLIQSNVTTSGRRVEYPKLSRGGKDQTLFTGRHCDTEEAPADTYSSLRTALGVNRNSFYTGLALARILDDPESVELLDLLKRGRRPHTPAAILQLQAELRAEYDPKLESGEMSVWSVRSAIGSRLITEDRERPAGVALQLDFWAAHLHPMTSAMHKWKEVPAEVRVRVINDIRTLINTLPDADRMALLEGVK